MGCQDCVERMQHVSNNMILGTISNNKESAPWKNRHVPFITAPSFKVVC